MFTRLLLASTSVLALGGFAAAADLTPTPPPVPAFTWAGLYLGGQIGFAWANDTGYVSNTGPISGPIGPSLAPSQLQLFPLALSLAWRTHQASSAALTLATIGK